MKKWRIRTLQVLIGILLILSLTVMIILNQAKFGQLPKGERLERILKSPNYEKGVFKNLSETTVMSSDKSTFSVMLDFMFSKKVNVTPKKELPIIKTDIKALDSETDVLIWFGHSSYFMRLDGTTFLVDPVFSSYASPFSFLNKAFQGTTIYSSDDIPEIDYLIISHDHWDHLDYKTILNLKSKVQQVICGLGVGQHFEYWGYNSSKIKELDWYENYSLKGIEITATPARHFSGRGIRRNKTLWASYVLQTENYNFFIGGDSGYDTFFEKIGSQYGPFDLAILEQGQYNKNWSLIHMLPEQLFNTAEQLQAKCIFPVHNSKFSLSNHSWDDPLKKMIKNLGTSNIPVITPKMGELVNFQDSVQTFSKWWEE